MNEDQPDSVEVVLHQDGRCDVPTFPRNLVRYRTWQSVRWFVVLLCPILFSAGMACNHDFGLSVIILLTGAATSAGLLVTISSGVASIFLGTYSRRREPVRYWLQVGVLIAAYLFVSSLGFLACMANGSA